MSSGDTGLAPAVYPMYTNTQIAMSAKAESPAAIRGGCFFQLRTMNAASAETYESTSVMVTTS
ncbi:hypothetical protein D3C87_1707940 [compost metagenome]